MIAGFPAVVDTGRSVDRVLIPTCRRLPAAPRSPLPLSPGLSPYSRRSPLLLLRLRALLVHGLRRPRCPPCRQLPSPSTRHRCSTPAPREAPQRDKDRLRRRGADAWWFARSALACSGAHVLPWSRLANPAGSARLCSVPCLPIKTSLGPQGLGHGRSRSGRGTLHG